MNIHLAISDPVGAAIKQVLGLTGQHAYTDLENAKLIIVGGKEDLLAIHTKDKYFVLLCQDDPGKLPTNAEWHKIPQLVVLMNLILDEKGIDQKLGIQGAVSTSKEVPIEQFGSGKLRILVVDDTAQNRTLARQLLRQHSVTIASSYGQAMGVIGKVSYDVVLTDLYLPMDRFHGTLAVSAIEIGVTVPYGLLIALEAAQSGADTAIVTDANHHKDCFSAAFGTLRKPYKVNGKKLLLINHVGKNWAKALELLQE